MPSQEHKWVFVVEKDHRDQLFLKVRTEEAVLESWRIRFQLPVGLQLEDAERLAAVMNTHLTKVACARLHKNGLAVLPQQSKDRRTEFQLEPERTRTAA